MNADQPQLRHRGYFITQAVDTAEAGGDLESAEGYPFRVRIVRPLRRRPPAARSTQSGAAPRTGQASDATAMVKSATETGTHRR